MQDKLKEENADERNMATSFQHKCASYFQESLVTTFKIPGSSHAGD